MVWDWMYGGVDHSLEGNGGPECASYLTFCRRFCETSIICAFALWCIRWGYRHLYLPNRLSENAEQRDRFGKRLLLVMMCLTFGCEIGFKLATKTVIYLLNPCHVVTMMQIYLLSAPPSRYVTIMFRTHLHCLNGAFLALAFPVLNTRLLPMEKEIYFIQHIMMIMIPFYLMRIGGVYALERLGDFSWAILTLGFMLLYHFILLQVLGLFTEVNLNNMLCPAVSDPFRGVNYRIWATGHQSVLISCLGKLYFLISQCILRLLGHTQSFYDPEVDDKDDDVHCSSESDSIKCPAQDEVSNSRERHSSSQGLSERQRLDAGDCNSYLASTAATTTAPFLNAIRSWSNKLWEYSSPTYPPHNSEFQRLTGASKTVKKQNSSNGNAEHID